MKDDQIKCAYQYAAPDNSTKARIWARILEEAELQTRQAPASENRPRLNAEAAPVSITVRKERPFLQRFGLVAACVALTAGVLAGGWLGYQKWMQSDPLDSVPGSSTEQLDPQGLQITPIWLDGNPCYDEKKPDDGLYSAIINDVSAFQGGMSNRILVKLNDGRFQIVDYMGHEIAVIESEEELGPFLSGVAVIKQNGKYGLIDSDGNCIAAAEYDRIGEISEGLIPVRKDRRWGFIDTAGQIVIPLEYEGADSYQDGLLSVELDGKWGCLDKNGQIVIPFEYEFSIDAYNGYAFAEQKNASPRLFDTSGQEIKLEKSISSYSAFNEGYCFVSWESDESTGQAEGCGYIDTTGQVVIQGDFDSGGAFSNGFAVVNKDGKKGYKDGKKGIIDTTGKLVVPIEYDFVLPFDSDCRVIVLKNDKWGVVDFEGQMVLPLEYDVCGHYSDGLTPVAKDGKWGYADVNGQIVIPMEYDLTLRFDNGFAAVCKDGKWGYIDRSGAIVVPIEYDGCISRALLGQVTLVKQGKRWGIVCLTGNE